MKKIGFMIFILVLGLGCKGKPLLSSGGGEEKAKPEAKKESPSFVSDAEAPDCSDLPGREIPTREGTVSIYKYYYEGAEKIFVGEVIEGKEYEFEGPGIPYVTFLTFKVKVPILNSTQGDLVRVRAYGLVFNGEAVITDERYPYIFWQGDTGIIFLLKIRKEYLLKEIREGRLREDDVIKNEPLYGYQAWWKIGSDGRIVDEPGRNPRVIGVDWRCAVRELLAIKEGKR
jgi:hypothetical protein